MIKHLIFRMMATFIAVMMLSSTATEDVQTEKSPNIENDFSEESAPVCGEALLSDEENEQYCWNEEGTFEGVLGFSGYYIDEVWFDGWVDRTYYVGSKPGCNGIKLAECYGFSLDTYSVDLDGDGKDEFLCNCVSGADCHQELYVFKLEGDTVKIGYVNWLKCNPESLYYWGCNAVYTCYDPVANKIMVRFCPSQDAEHHECVYVESDIIDYEIWDKESFPFIDQEEAFNKYGIKMEQNAQTL